MTKLLDEKIGNFSIVDGFLITASKIGTEEVLSRVPFVGNGTYKSGLMKVGGALLGSMTSKNKYVQYLSTGLLLDGAEDILANVKNMGMKTNTQNNREVIL